MKCRICNNESGNMQLVLREMMFGFRDEFSYFQCGNCGCIQIEEIPDNLAKYYPSGYYSFNVASVPLKRSRVRSIHFDYEFGKKKLVGRLLALKFKPSLFYEWLKNLGLNSRDKSVLDIGCGSGRLLKRMYRLGFNNLTGIDPFLDSDKEYNKSIRLLKKDIFEAKGNFDIVMMHHSLEHMDHQHKVIQRAAALLNNGGRMLIRIPIVSKPLMEKYGVNVVSLDPPRHFFIHSLQSIRMLIEQHGLFIYKTVFDADMFSILGSEQYLNDISNVNDRRSHFQNPGNSIFAEADLIKARQEIDTYNQQAESDSVALYIRKN